MLSPCGWIGDRDQDAVSHEDAEAGSSDAQNSEGRERAIVTRTRFFSTLSEKLMVKNVAQNVSMYLMIEKNNL